MRKGNDAEPAESGSGTTRLWAALSDIQQWVKANPELELALVICSVHPDAAFFRLSPESSQRLRNDISGRLHSLLRANDSLYATGHWEWLIVMPAMRSSATVTMATLKIDQVLRHQDLSIDGIRLNLPVFCGASLFPEDGDDPLYLLQSARIACLHAQRNGSSGAFYESSMEELDQRMKEFDVELRSALSGDSSLQLVLQPQVDAKTEQCVGAEALVRWQRRDGEKVPPGELLAAIDRLGLRASFNRWLFVSASRICADLDKAGISIRLSINISANDLLDPELLDLILQSLEVWQVAPERLLLEITETSMVQEDESVTGVLKRCRELGIGLSIDDFGTGFSGMSHLKQLPVEEVKIDQSFVRNLVHSRRDHEIVESIIRLSHRLKITVVAEGIEDRETASLLAQLGCDILQGYLFSEPVPFELFCAWHRRSIADATETARQTR
jgi:EAL domain-containing protein (putative c-di-GMP-specific phosphodiesterase class I)